MKYLIFCYFFTFFAFTALKTHGPYKSEKFQYQAKQVFQADDIIWGFDFFTKDELILTLKEGKILLVDISNNTSIEIKNVPPVYTANQGGLLDVRVSPFVKDEIFFSYSVKLKDQYTTRLAKARLNRGAKKLDRVQILFTAKTDSTRSIHFGSRIVFKDGHVYLTVGDRGQRDKAQSLNYHNGSVIRLLPDGSPVKDNPFQQNEVAKYIYSFGHRNPQGLAIDPKNKQLIEQEHGPRGGDEINFIKKGANYGWPVITYGKEYYGPSIGEGTTKPGMEQPLYYYVPSIAPSGLAVYRGSKYPEWDGSIFSGALKLQHLNRLEIQPDKSIKEERLLEDLASRIRNVRQSPDEYLYISSDDGELLRIEKVITK